MTTQWSVLLNVSASSALQIYQTVSKSDGELTLAVPPQTLILLPTPTPATQVEFCNMTTAKLLLIDFVGTINIWLNTDPTVDPPLILTGPMLITSDITSVFVQNPGGMTPITVKVTVVGI